MTAAVTIASCSILRSLRVLRISGGPRREEKRLLLGVAFLARGVERNGRPRAHPRKIPFDVFLAGREVRTRQEERLVGQHGTPGGQGRKQAQTSSPQKAGQPTRAQAWTRGESRSGQRARSHDAARYRFCIPILPGMVTIVTLAGLLCIFPHHVACIRTLDP